MTQADTGWLDDFLARIERFDAAWRAAGQAEPAPHAMAPDTDDADDQDPAP
jgi:hypothetical protein